MYTLIHNLYHCYTGLNISFQADNVEIQRELDQCTLSSGHPPFIFRFGAAALDDGPGSHRTRQASVGKIWISFVFIRGSMSSQVSDEPIVEKLEGATQYEMGHGME